MSSKLVQIEVPLDTRQKIKVLASLEGQTTPEWVEWIVAKSYEAKMAYQSKVGSKRKHIKH